MAKSSQDKPGGSTLRYSGAVVVVVVVVDGGVVDGEVVDGGAVVVEAAVVEVDVEPMVVVIGGGAVTVVRTSAGPASEVRVLVGDSPAV